MTDPMTWPIPRDFSYTGPGYREQNGSLVLNEGYEWLYRDGKWQVVAIGEPVGHTRDLKDVAEVTPIPLTQAQYDAVAAECRELMLKKNADYGDSWREMRPSTITDLILVKVRRLIQLEALQMRGESPQVSEGIESECRDIANYALFRLILEGEMTDRW